MVHFKNGLFAGTCILLLEVPVKAHKVHSVLRVQLEGKVPHHFLPKDVLFALHFRVLLTFPALLAFPALQASLDRANWLVDELIAGRHPARQCPLEKFQRERQVILLLEIRLRDEVLPLPMFQTDYKGDWILALLLCGTVSLATESRSSHGNETTLEFQVVLAKINERLYLSFWIVCLAKIFAKGLVLELELVDHFNNFFGGPIDNVARWFTKLELLLQTKTDFSEYFKDVDGIYEIRIVFCILLLAEYCEWFGNFVAYHATEEIVNWFILVFNLHFFCKNFDKCRVDLQYSLLIINMTFQLMQLTAEGLQC